MGYPPIHAIGANGSIGSLVPGKGRIKYEWNPFQQTLLEACFKHSLVVATTAVRTGKTGAVCAFHRFQARHNPGVFGIWLVESLKWYKRTAHPVCLQLFGREAVWHGTDYTWTWPNGARVYVCTYQQLDSMEGITAGWASIDEHQNVGRDAFDVLLPRVSDKNAKFPCVLITGLPVFDSWADNLAEQNPNAAHFTEVSTSVNATNVHPGYFEHMRENLSPAEYKRRLSGEKPMLKGRVIADWEPQEWRPAIDGQGGNLIEWRANPKLRTFLYVDWGFRCPAYVFVQHDPNLGVDVFVNEWHPANVSTEVTAQGLLDGFCVPRSLWRPGDPRLPIDEIYCDPAGNTHQTATGLGDIRVFQERFGGVPIKYTYSSRLRKPSVGIRMCQARVLNAQGKRRHLMCSEMWERGLKQRQLGEGTRHGKNGRSMALSILRSAYPEDREGRPLSDEPIDCPVDSHALDAWRYGIVNRYGVSAAGTFAAR